MYKGHVAALRDKFQFAPEFILKINDRGIKTLLMSFLDDILQIRYTEHSGKLESLVGASDKAFA